MRIAVRAVLVVLVCAAIRMMTTLSARPAEPDGAARAVWVFLHPDSTRTDAPPALSDGALASRAERGLGVLENDRPIPAELLDRLREAGATIRYASRWLRAVSIEADEAVLERIRRIPAVAGLRPVGRMERAGDWDGPARAREAAVCGPGGQVYDSAFYGPNWSVIRALGIPAAHQSGFTGSNVRIAILDTGFEPGHESLASRSVIAARDYVQGDSDVTDAPGENQASHGTQVWSLVGGMCPGEIVGPAFGARYLLAKVDAEPGDTRADEDRWVAAVEWADSMDIDLIVSALTFRYDFTDRPAYLFEELDGETTPTTRMTDEAVRRGMLVVNAIGDHGPGANTLTAPADADSVLSVGALDLNNRPASFGTAATSQGPTVDGRVKPEVSVRGVALRAASAASPTGYDSGLAGTSYAAALVGGAAALFMEAWPNLTAAAVRNALVLAGSFSASPDNAVGAGTPDVGGAILFPSGLVATTVETVDPQGVLTTVAPVFRWRADLIHQSFRPVLYRVEVATDPAFSNVIYSDTVREAFSLAARRAIRPAAALYWRVSGSDLANRVRRTSRPGQTLRMPNWVRLVSPDPAQVSFVQTERPELRWTPLTAPAPVGPFVYDVEILSNDTRQPVQPKIRDVTAASITVPQPLVANTAYRWRVIARTRFGQADTVESTNPFVITSATQPPTTLLYQNFPNPFPRPELGQSETRVWFDLAETANVELHVLDLRGRMIRSLIPADPSCGRTTLEPGLYGRGGPIGPQPGPCVRTTWDGTDAEGRIVPRGVYLLRLRANGRTLYRRMLFLPEG